MPDSPQDNHENTHETQLLRRQKDAETEVAVSEFFIFLLRPSCLDWSTLRHQWPSKLIALTPGFEPARTGHAPDNVVCANRELLWLLAENSAL